MTEQRTSKKVVPAQHPAAFINVISEEGTKAEAVEWLQRTWDDLVDEKAKTERLERELERERMRLAACGVVAMSNTPETAARNRDMHEDYRSASCDDVARAVDREMSLRAERDALRAALEEVRSAADDLRDDVRRRIERIEWITEEALDAARPPSNGTDANT